MGSIYIHSTDARFRDREKGKLVMLRNFEISNSNNTMTAGTVMEKKVRVDLDYIVPNKSFVYPLYSMSGRVVLPERVVLTEERIKKIKRIYGNMVYYIENEYEPVTAPAPSTKGSFPGRLTEKALGSSRDILGEIAKTNKLSRSSYQKAERVVEDIVSELDYADIKAISLLKDMKSYDEYIYQHLVNVGMLSALFAQKIGGFSQEDIKNITMGSYLIDIGLMKIDPQLLKKEGAYTVTDIQQIKRHPQLGYEMLKDFTDINPIVLQTILLHHERFNNRGYYGLPYENLPISPKIASVCDIYDACTTKRPYRDAYTPNKTMRVLLNSINRSFDQRIITDFINFMWPMIMDDRAIFEKDDFCVLNSNEIARIKELHRGSDILKPKVDVFCRYKLVNKKTEISFYKRAVEVDLRNDVDRQLVKIITEKSHVDFLKAKLVQNKLLS